MSDPLDVIAKVVAADLSVMLASLPHDHPNYAQLPNGDPRRMLWDDQAKQESASRERLRRLRLRRDRGDY